MGTNIITDDECPKVSRKHAKITYKDEKWKIQDTKSTHGTWVNGLKLEEHEEKEIKNDDHIKLANVVFKVVIEGE